MEKQFTLISQGDNTVTYDLGDGPMPAESCFYSAGYPDASGDFVAVEHRTMNYFGTRLIPVNKVTVNGLTFTTALAAVAAINSLDLSLRSSDEIGSLAAHTDIKSLDAPTVTMPDPINDGETITKALAFTEDIPVIPPQPRQDITDLFAFSPDVAEETKHVIVEDFGEGRAPIVEVFASNEGPGTDDLVIEAPFGFGSIYAYTADNTDGNRTLPLLGVDGIVHYGTITPETYDEDGTPISKSIITIPAAVTNFTIKYPRGAVRDTTSSYYIDTNGVAHLFTAAGTPLSGFVTSTSTFDPCIIEGVSVPRATIQKIVFGQDYNAITTIPAGFLNNMLAANFEMNLAGLKNVTTLDGFNGCSVKYLDISMFTNVTSIAWGVFGRYDQLLEIQIGSMDWSKINTAGKNPFYKFTARPAGIIRADTQALGEAFRTACAPSLDDWTVVVNP